MADSRLPKIAALTASGTLDNTYSFIVEDANNDKFKATIDNLPTAGVKTVTDNGGIIKVDNTDPANPVVTPDWSDLSSVFPTLRDTRIPYWNETTFTFDNDAGFTRNYNNWYETDIDATNLGGFNANVYAMKYQSSGKIIVAGQFTTYSDATLYKVGRIVRLNTDGTVDTSFPQGGGTGFNGKVFDIAIDSSDGIYVVGQFSEYTDGTGTYYVNGVVHLNSDGTFDAGFLDGVKVSNHVKGFIFPVYATNVKLDSNGKIVVAGGFTYYRDSADTLISVGPVVRLNTDGTLDVSTNIVLTYPSSIIKIALQANDDIIIGGNFTSISSVNYNGLARLETTGLTLDTTFINTTGNRGFTLTTGPQKPFVESIAIDSSDNIYIGGIMQSNANWTDSSGINNSMGMMRLSPNGVFDNTFLANGTQGFDAGVPINAYITNIFIDQNGKLLISGNFIRFTDSTSTLYSTQRMIRVNTDGTLDTTLPYGPLYGFQHYNWTYTCLDVVGGGYFLGGFITKWYDSPTDFFVLNNLIKISDVGIWDTTFNVGGRGYSHHLHLSGGGTDASYLRTYSLDGLQFSQVYVSPDSGAVLFNQFGSNYTGIELQNQGNPGIRFWSETGQYFFPRDHGAIGEVLTDTDGAGTLGWTVGGGGSGSFLKLDQSTPQTITGGIPLLEATHLPFSQDHQIIDKEYADSLAGWGMKSFFFTKTSSDVGWMYVATTILPPWWVQTITGTAADWESIIASFITNVATSEYRVTDGSRFFYFTAKTSSATKPQQLKWYIYQTDINGANPVLLRTSSLSLPLTTIDSTYFTNMWWDSLLIPTTMRIKFVVAVVKTGTSWGDPTVTLSVEDNTYSRLDVPSPVWVTDLSSVLHIDQTTPQTTVGQLQFPEARFGTSVNNTIFEADGTMKMNGAATVFNDWWIPAHSLRNGTTPPTWAAWNGSLYAPEFINAATCDLHWSFELLHQYKEWSDVEIHIHWSPSTTNTGNCRWVLDYSVANIDWTFPAPTTIGISPAASGVVRKMSWTSFGTISGAGLKIWAVIDFRIYRLWNDWADTFTGAAFLHNVGCHHECDTIGSRTESDK